MIKHAANEDEAILSAEERVNRAFERIKAGTSFADNQMQWLERIRAHLIANLTIDKADFDTLPIFQREGGWNVANEVFGNHLETILHEFNLRIPCGLPQGDLVTYKNFWCCEAASPWRNTLWSCHRDSQGEGNFLF